MSKPQKIDNLDSEHLEWLVSRRSQNQEATLKLFQLFKAYSGKKKTLVLSKIASSLVAICFSHWRAVFLADKTGDREYVFDDATAFLGKLITDNSITYVQDRNAREWTFNYYMNTAAHSLAILGRKWDPVRILMETPKKRRKKKGEKRPKAPPAAKRRWDRQHAAFVEAMRCFEDEFSKAPDLKAPSTTKPKAKAS